MDSVTIRMLLSHSAGFQNPTWPYTQGKPWQPFEPTTWNQLVAMMPYQELLFKPGARFSYSNPGFIYLARVIEQLSGDPWESYVQTKHLQPAGSHPELLRPHTVLSPRRRSLAQLHAHARFGRPRGRQRQWCRLRPGITIPNGGWNASLGDLATYVAFLTNATHGDATTQRLYDTVLSHATLEEMWRPLYQTKEDGSSIESDSLGLSFFIAHHGETRFVGHTGSQAGFLAFLYINPATGAGVVAAFNTATDFNEPGHVSAFQRIRDAALELIG